MARFGNRCACCRQAKWGRSARYRLVLPTGTYSTVPTWASREHWLAEVLPAAITHGRAVLREHHIAPATFARILALHAVHGDDDTGRGVTIDVEHLRLEAACSERTVQRARAAARELGIAREVFRGRHLNLLERIEAYDRGSKQRGLASVYALGCPQWLAVHLPQRLLPTQLVDRQVGRVAGERGTPPVGSPSGSSPLQRSHGSSPTSGDDLAPLDVLTKQGRPDPGHGSHHRPGHGSTAHNQAADTPPEQRRRLPHRRAGTTPSKPNGPATPRRPRRHPGAVRLAEDLRREIPVLRRTQVGRLVPALTRFAASPTTWTVAELVPLIWHVARVKGWTTNPAKIRNPSVWLAHLLQGIADTDPHDLPRNHPDHPSAETDSSAVITPDDPWAATLLPQSAAADRERRDGLGWALTGNVTAPELPIHLVDREHRHESLWDARSRTYRHEHRRAEIARDRHDQAAAAAERRGENLCEHGAGGADPTTGRSHRCAHCRATTRGLS